MRPTGGIRPCGGCGQRDGAVPRSPGRDPADRRRPQPRYPGRRTNQTPPIPTFVRSLPPSPGQERRRNQVRGRCPGRSVRVTPNQLLVLYLLFPLIKAQRRQAVALSPVVQACLLVALQPAGGGAAHPGGAVDLQRAVEQPGDQHPDHGHRQGGGLDFPPAWLPHSGTRSPPAPAPCGGASPTTS